MMSGRALQSPLLGRLIGWHLVWTLAGLLTCVAAALILFWRNQLSESVALVAVLPLTLALLGSYQLRRSLSVTAVIDSQLLQAGSLSALSDLQLQLVPAANDTARGWNMIVERLAGRAALQRLESRLQEVLCRVDDNKLDQILNSLPDGIAVTNSDGRVSLSNKAFASLIRVDREAPVTGKRPEEAFAWERASNAREIQHLLRETLRPIVFEVPMGAQLADGVLRIARYPLVAAEQCSAAHVWSVRDVTQQKLAEEMRNQFVATATHELRTPLANIKAYAETLAGHADISAEQQHEFYNVISAEATRLSRFVDELLNVSQMESGALSLTLHETDVARLVDEVAEHVQPEIHRKKIVFERHLPPKLPKIQADKDKLAAALVNLLGNAVKYTAECGRVGLQIECDNRELHFHIEDTGYGIAPEELSRVFDKFFRSGDDRVRGTNGSGLGLTFTQEAARLHGGRVTVHSELNKGSRFTLTLPLAV